MTITCINSRRWVVTDANGNEIGPAKTKREAQIVLHRAVEEQAKAEAPAQKTAGG